MGKQSHDKGHLSWSKLALLGLGFTTGTGFFLGSSMAIEKSGFSVLFLFGLAAFGTYFIFDVLAQMIAQHVETDSFRAYSTEAFGQWAGFCHGWIYWLSEILILGSQLTAIGLFTKFWFPDISLWMLSSLYAVMGIVIVWLGTKGFEQAEYLFAVVKVSALVMFIILALLVVNGVLGQENAHMHMPENSVHFFADGAMGMWTSLIFVFFAFAGIEVMGLMATQLIQPKDAPKSGKVMLSIISVLYICSIGFALLLAPMDSFNADESPFVTALKDLKLTVIVHIFNGVLIVAGFSSLVASLYSVTQMLYLIAQTGDAPKIFANKNKHNLPYASLLVTIGGMAVSIVLALLLPEKIYEYITTAGGLMLLYSWLFIVFASRKVLRLSVWGHFKTIAATGLLLLAVSGTLLDKTSQIGFITSLIFLVMIGGGVLFMRTRWKKIQQD